MKKGIHPEYNSVVFMDTSTGHKFLMQTTLTSKETIEWEEDGKEYPLVKVDISSASHPYFTGKMKFVDAAGRVEKFQRKYNWDKRNKAGAAKADEAAAE
ncbi:MAG: type B 50S ribosomal protein L31 [Planctomycetaceae bacterium]|nr:type B 50S ribosomal protein L31 [Planctomycetaceae bacterium]